MISTRELNTNEILVTFTVRDTGIGIRREDIGKLFDDYIQLDTRTNREVEGTGLGLSISKRIAEMMGGDITVESEYGSGSCFTAHIVQRRSGTSIIGNDKAAALRSCRHISQTGVVEKKKPIAESSAALLSFRILAVDDNMNNLLLIREQLKPCGLQVDAVSSGQEAIEKIETMNKQNFRYNLILMDHMMPGMDGIETMKAIRNIQYYADVPIIILTANALRGMREYYLEQGFTDFIAKPVNQQALNEVIMKHLSGRGIPITEAGELSFVFSGELIRQRLDTLNHIRAAFEIVADSEVSVEEINDEYFRRLIDLLVLLNSMRLSETLAEQSKTLINAAQRKDAAAIRNMLSSYCKEFQLWAERDIFTAEPAVKEIVQQLQKAILDGDAVTAGKTVKELGSAKLTSAERELYFDIYDALMDDNNEKALERIEEWLK